MTVHSDSVPDLTLIDLPGITRVPIDDQPENIEQITKEMCIHYCKDPNTIILCVIPANQDLSTQDSIVLAKKLDPDGSRTLGVLTKVDLMDEGTDCSKILMNKEIKLKLGYVAVKGRSQAEVNRKTTGKLNTNKSQRGYQKRNEFFPRTSSVLNNALRFIGNTIYDYSIVKCFIESH